MQPFSAALFFATREPAVLSENSGSVLFYVISETGPAHRHGTCKDCAGSFPRNRSPCHEALIKNVIELFCTENLAEEEAA